MHLCVAGWIDGKQVGYPIRFPAPKCGLNKTGVIQYKNPNVNTPYDAYCYRIRGTYKMYQINLIKFEVQCTILIIAYLNNLK